MVINAGELDIDGVLVAIVGMVVGLLLSTILIGVLIARLGRRRFRASMLAPGFCVALALLVDVIVVSRAISGEATGWDLIWAAGLTFGAAWAVRRCVQDRAPSNVSSE